MPAPKLATGDGASGLRKALTMVLPHAKEQHRWFHKSSDVLGASPKPQRPGAVKAIRETRQAANRADAVKAAEQFTKAYGAKWPNPAANINNDLDELLAFYDFPAPHWARPRTSNPIESVFSTVKARTKAARAAG
jgi:transposase-like protein